MTDSAPRIEQSGKRVRVMAGGRVVADSTGPLLVWEIPYYPTYYFSTGDVDTQLLTKAENHRFDLVLGDDRRAGVAYRNVDIPDLADHIAFRWDGMDHWFEEDEEVFVHARNPRTRIDVLRSSRRVMVEIDGVEVADSTSASFLFETGLPTRYYLPKTDVRFEYFKPTDTVSRCPYKGEARYWTAEINGQVHEDVLWGYDYPLPESQKVAGLVCFYTEKVDVFVDRSPI